MQLVTNAIAIDEHTHDKFMTEMTELTGLDNPGSVQQLKGYLADNGVVTDTLGKKVVAVLIEEAPDDVRQVLELRQQTAKSSIKKYQTMERAACSDDRIRGMFQFMGAPRTGRFAGRLVQLQNLKRNSMPDLAEARELVRTGNYEAMELLYDSVPEVLSELIRTALVPKPGYKFYVADYSAVEARCLSFLAKEQWRIQTDTEIKYFFPYVVMAFKHMLLRMYHEYMRNQLIILHNALEKEGQSPFPPGITERLYTYEENRKEASRRSKERANERQTEKQIAKEKNHAKYMRNRERYLARSKEYHDARKEEDREYRKRYYQENKKKIDAKNRKWAKKNRDKANEYARKYREAHEEEIKEKQEKFKQEHPEKPREWQHAHRERHPRPLKKPGTAANVCYGYKQSASGKWIIDRPQAKVVIKIFEWYIEGDSSIGIQRRLFLEHVPSPSGNEEWNTNTIKWILKNERYMGTLVVKPGSKFGKEIEEDVIIENYYPIIISEALFRQAEEAGKRRTNRVIVNGKSQMKKGHRYSEKRGY